MLKKYVQLYKESFKLATMYPQFILLFLFTNIDTFYINFLDEGSIINIDNPIVFAVSQLIKVGALAITGYLIIGLLRKNHLPNQILIGGKRNLWRVFKYMIFQFIVLTLSSVLPLIILESSTVLPMYLDSFLLWINEFIFVFLTFETLFWENEKVLKSYRVRNIYMLARFEWIFLVYVIFKLPNILLGLLRLYQIDWFFSGIGMILSMLIIISWEWVNRIFVFKVYGSDRIQVAEEMRERVRQSEKAYREKRKKRKNK